MIPVVTNLVRTDGGISTHGYTRLQRFICNNILRHIHPTYESVIDRFKPAVCEYELTRFLGGLHCKTSIKDERTNDYTLHKP
jgi:hypothetical protein